MDDKELSALKALAEAATPGPWIAHEATDSLHAVRTANSRIVADVGYSGSLDRDKDNAAYIAAANPQAILSLISRVEQAEAASTERANNAIDQTILSMRENCAKGDNTSVDLIGVTLWHHNEFSKEMHIDPCGEYVKLTDIQTLLAAPENTLIGKSSICVCGEPETEGVIHRTDGPCYVTECATPARDVGGLTESNVYEIYGEAVGISIFERDKSMVLKFANAIAAALATSPAPSVKQETKLTVRDGIWWPEGYCTDPNGRIVAPAGKHIDFKFGYDIGYRDGLVAHKDAVAAIAAPSASQGEVKAPEGFAVVLDEIERATRKFPTWPTDPLHAVAVLGEEFGELTKAVLQTTYEPHKMKVGELRTEAIQTAAMALRFLASLDCYEFAQCAQHAQSAAPAPSVMDGEKK